ncbi:DegT/DnrJ/EryC1/StrS family aminotransferase [Longimicrobium sp.]|jgi:dTDP-4-amino-4,6-dideoxygalactose transaminase/nucleoside-diphosphate-sugar epimerase|uniref:DegT/DnrJ/EryC1/StrS family aminotransferase n=1 Tax=Longimicrobium sp. TaxID=2029185 RepID=UPI002EDB69B2
MRVLVTGGLGFVGGYVCAELARCGIEAVAVDNGWFNGEPLEPAAVLEVDRRRARLAALDGVSFREVDLRDREAVHAVVADCRPTHVLHLAGLSRADVASRAPQLAFEANLAATNALLLACEAAGGAQRVVFASSSLVYGSFESDSAAETHPTRPEEPYGASKLAAEVLVTAWGRRTGVEAVIVRASAVYGPGDFNGRVVQRFVDAALAGRELELFDNGDEKLDFTWVEDAARALVLALDAPDAAGEVLNVSAGDARPLRTLAEVVRTYIPEARLVPRPERPRRPRRGTLDSAKTRRVLGFEPRVPLEEGVRLLVAHAGRAVPDRAVPRVDAPAPVPLGAPSIGEAELAAVARSLRSGWLTHSPENEAFEAEFARHVGVSHGLGLNSCASALQLALEASGVRGEVIVPAFTYVATANAVVRAGATPIFADVEPLTLGLDVDAVRAAIGPHTEAILAVHIAGAPCDIGALAELARSHGLLLVEDAAQAAGAQVDGRRVGSFGGAGCFSFFPTKNMTTGEGGMLVSGDERLVARARALASHGVDRSPRARPAVPWARRITEPGANFRLSAPQAALGRVQLARVDAMNEARAQLAARLSAGLADTGLALPYRRGGTTHVYQMYVARAAPPLRRDELVHAIRASGVEASVHYDLPVPRERPYAPHAKGPFPVAEQAAREVLTLPLFPDLAPSSVDRIVSAVHHALRAQRG